MSSQEFRNRRGRRRLLKTAMALAGGGAARLLLPGEIGRRVTAAQQTALQQTAAQKTAAAPATAASQLILLGTQGGPNINLKRGQAASAIVTNGTPYLIDCGYGTLRALVQAGLRLNDVANVFVTHLHDDHTADIAAMLSLKWTGGQPQPQATTILGPYGTAAMVQGAIAFFKGNTDIRTTDEGRTAAPEAFFRGRDLSAPAITEVFRDKLVTVRAVENTHYPDRATAKMAHRSFAYRFEMADRAIVFSGDTAYSPALVTLARNADVLVCETIDMAMHAQLRKAAQAEPGGLTVESVPRHIIETHVTTEEAGRIAAEAGVRTLVLNHLLPGSNPQRGGDIPDAQYVEGVRRHFKGEVVVGADQMRM